MRSPRLRAVQFTLALAVLTPPATAWAGEEAEACANAAEQAQALRKDGKLTEARERLLVCMHDECPDFIRDDCAGWLSEVDSTLPSFVVRAVDGEGKDVTDVRVLIDGKVAADKLDGRPLSVDPGEHSITYESPGFASVTESVLIRQGETNRLLSVAFAPTAQAPDPAPEPPRRSIPTLTWILGGVGVVAVGAGAALWLSGTSDHGSLEDGCARTKSCAQSDVDSAQTKLLVGDIAMGVGLVAVGAAVIFALVNKAAPAHAQQALSSAGLGVPLP